jgi:hypothetical protein
LTTRVRAPSIVVSGRTGSTSGNRRSRHYVRSDRGESQSTRELNRCTKGEIRMEQKHRNAWAACAARAPWIVAGVAAACLAMPASAAKPNPSPKWSTAKAFDVSKPLRELPSQARAIGKIDPDAEYEVRPERGAVPEDRGHTGDGALQKPKAGALLSAAIGIQPPLVTFEGLSNQDNFTLFGGRVNPPDPVGDVGLNHYVQMINLAYAVYDKQGNKLLGPVDTGELWNGFPIEDCTDPSGDPIVLYDQLADRWILSQFTTRGNPYYYNCVAISQTGDPTGAYYRYAFVTQEDRDGLYYFPDYPKYGVWTTSYVLTTRDFGDAGGYGVSIYALEKNKMLAGHPNARAVQFFIDSEVVPINLIGDGLLPPDIDGTRRPQDHVPIPIVGTQDDNFAPYGATFDALNIWEMTIKWNATPDASLTLATQLPTAAFDSVFPCPGGGRRCLPQPGAAVSQYLDILSYRQRPTFRLAYRNFGTYETLVTSQSVEAAPGVAGMRWYEIRRTSPRPNAAFTYSIFQQGTFSQNDGVHRWMGSAAMDRQGNIAMGYSVTGMSVFPGIRYTGRLAGDPLGTMPLGEETIVNGSGIQRSTNNRWGDYSSLNVDPTDDCTFWYVNEYYTAAGQASSTAGWQTRIGSFKLPGCTAR